MKNAMTKSAVAVAFLAASGATLAEVSGSVALTSDYIFDGISQSDNSPALQVGLDYGHDSGFYMGAWASNVDYGTDVNLETDFYGGFTFGSEALSFDLGAVYYMYTDSLSSPESDSDYYELYAGVTFAENLTLKGWYADDYANAGFAAYRLKATYDIALNDTWSIPLEYTFTDYDQEGTDSYNHIRVGIAADFDPISIDVSYHKTDIDVEEGVDPDLYTADGLIVATATFSF